MVVVDPPTFSTTKGRVFTASKDYVELVGAAASVLEPGGILCAASNAAKLSFADFERAVGRGLATAGREGLVLKHLGLPPDYPVLPGFEEGRYLKFLGVVVW